MTVFTQISKELGWEPRRVSIPTQQKAETLLQEVRESNITAFKEVFLINRFAAETPDNPDEEAAMGVIHQAFLEGRVIFEFQEVQP